MLRAASGYRIDPAFIERVATKNAPNAQPPAAPEPMQRYRFVSVMGAGWVKTTLIADPWTQRHLVAVYDGTSEPLCPILMRCIDGE